jgi:proteasome lid subunit RPN8/RPN11
MTRPPADRAGRAETTGPATPPRYDRLSRVVLTDEVTRTLFDEYAAHRASDRGGEETGWVLLGTRDVEEAVVLATLPAGADRDAGEAHVRFNSAAQALASRIVRQGDRRLTLLGVVHTHPGSLRHPSRGDLRGDREWVPQLRGGEGVFGIGTADAGPESGDSRISHRPHRHMQCLGPLRFTWYTLAAGDRKYREVPIELTIGPDLARPLRPVWAAIEEHADRLDRLARQQARVRFDVAEGRHGPALAVTVGLADPGHAVRVLLEGKEVRFYHEAGGQLLQADLPDTPPDQGVYLLLAELAGRG